ncbi:MAG: glycosyltransferase, partial [Planctomycetota bacterium]
DLALCRAGGTTIAELRCRELPAVLVPYPQAAGQHQHRNAEAASADRGAWVREEHELGARGFGEVIELLLDRSWLEFMGRRIAERARPDAGRSIALRLLGDDR